MQTIRKRVRAERCIVDGEMLVWHKGTKEWVAFGQNRSVARNMGEREHAITFMVFDVIFVEGAPPGCLPPCVTSSNLMANTYEERRGVLRKIIQVQANLIEVVAAKC